MNNDVATPSAAEAQTEFSINEQAAIATEPAAEPAAPAAEVTNEPASA